MDHQAHDGPIPDLGRLGADLETRFGTVDVLGVIVFDLSVLATVERRSGEAARRQVFDAACEIVSDVAREHLSSEDLIALGETGRNEILVLIFRDHDSARFYRQELPRFDQAVRRMLELRGNKVFYPHLRRAPAVSSGVGTAIRNPKLAVATQVRRAVEEAREAAALDRRVRAHEDRREFVEMLLDRRIHSVYEPIVEVTSKTVFGYEALARGPEGTKYHSPIALFGMADRLDMVYELDCLCRASGLRGAVDFPAGTKLFLNILPTAFHDPHFRAERLAQTLAASELSPSDVVFEISEQESIDDYAVFKEKSDEYRAMGFGFALDDTGSGYAGLEALLEIQPEYVKIDRAFVSGVDKDPVRVHMLRAVLDLAENLGAKVIGEGLDTLEELETLDRVGIHFGQGWLFGHPTPLRAAE